MANPFTSVFLPSVAGSAGAAGTGALQGMAEGEEKRLLNELIRMQIETEKVKPSYYHSLAGYREALAGLTGSKGASEKALVQLLDDIRSNPDLLSDPAVMAALQALGKRSQYQTVAPGAGVLNVPTGGITTTQPKGPMVVPGGSSVYTPGQGMTGTGTFTPGPKKQYAPQPRTMSRIQAEAYDAWKKAGGTQEALNQLQPSYQSAIRAFEEGKKKESTIAVMPNPITGKQETRSTYRGPDVKTYQTAYEIAMKLMPRYLNKEEAKDALKQMKNAVKRRAFEDAMNAYFEGR